MEEVHALTDLLRLQHPIYDDLLKVTIMSPVFDEKEQEKIKARIKQLLNIQD